MLDNANIAILLVAGDGLLAVLAVAMVGVVQTLVLDLATVVEVAVGILEVEVRAKGQEGLVQAALASHDVIGLLLKVVVVPVDDTTELRIPKLLDGLRCRSTIAVSVDEVNVLANDAVAGAAATKTVACDIHETPIVHIGNAANVIKGNAKRISKCGHCRNVLVCKNERK